MLIDVSKTISYPPGIFVLFDGMCLVAKRVEHVPNSEPPSVRIPSAGRRYSAYERTVEEVNGVGRVRWYATET